MPNDRFFIDCPLQEATFVTLSKEEHHHLSHVMRIQVGETIEIINGKGDLAQATLKRIEKKESSLWISSSCHIPPPPQTLSLAIGLPRFNRLEFIVEKLVELGIDSLLLFPAALSEKKELSANQWERLHHLCIAALKQSGRLYLPHLKLLPPLSFWEKPKEKLYFGHTKKAPWLLSCFEREKDSLLFIGPEKGFTEEEVFLLENTFHAQGICLNNHILRVDTAAIAAASLMSCHERFA